MIEKFKKNKLLMIGAIVAVVLIIGAMMLKNSVDANRVVMEQQKIEEEIAAEIAAEELESGGANLAPGMDEMLVTSQKELNVTFGNPPEGFLWELDGGLLSLGDQSLPQENVLYTYLRAISSLDMSVVQKFTRGSLVVDTYSGYFSELAGSMPTSEEDFSRKMYRQAMLNLQVQGIKDTTVFADNKVVFTVEATVLDLTKKDFWQKDKKKIFEDLFLYEDSESDTEKSEIYLYNYLLKYYQSDAAPSRPVDFDITLEKYPDLGTGWLVSIDGDLDNTFKYADGTDVLTYILEQYSAYKTERLMG